MTCGIYEIVHIASGKRYIGHSKQIEFRWWQHRGNLDQGLHVNVHLQRAWLRYGCDAFLFRVVETCSESMLLEREQAYINLYWETPGALFNIAREAHRPSMKGKSQSNFQKRRISEVHRGKVLSEETKQKLREANLGKIQSEETRQKHRNYRASLETRAKMSAAKRDPWDQERIQRREVTKIFLRALRRIFD